MVDTVMRSAGVVYHDRTVVQIRANDHSTVKYCIKRRCHDLVPTLVRIGWRALLVEPLPHAAANLRSLYAEQIKQGRVSVVEEAVCTNISASTMKIYFLDNSSTATFGSNESDVRCLRIGQPVMLREAASLDPRMIY